MRSPYTPHLCAPKQTASPSVATQWNVQQCGSGYADARVHAVPAAPADLTSAEDFKAHRTNRGWFSQQAK